MSIKRITSLLVGVAFVGGSLVTYLFAPREDVGRCGLLLLVMWIVGMVLTWKSIWGEE